MTTFGKELPILEFVLNQDYPFEPVLRFSEEYLNSGSVAPTNKLMMLVGLRQHLEEKMLDMYIECKDDMPKHVFEGMMRAMDPKALGSLQTAEALLNKIEKKEK